MNERELGALLGSSALDLEPPADLLEGVRLGARRVRRRRAAGAVALSVLLVAGAVSIGPDLVGGRDGDRRGDGRGDTVQPAAGGGDPRFPDATTTVTPLLDFNGGEVLTFFRGRQWCTASVRSGDPNTTCAGSVGPQTPVAPLAVVRGPGQESLAIDRDYLVAGLLGDGVERVVVVLARGELTASTVQADDWPRGVWFQAVRAGDRVLSYAAYAADGTLLARRKA